MSCFNNDCDCDRDCGCGCDDFDGFDGGRCCGRRRGCGFFGGFGGCGRRRRRCGCGCGNCGRDCCRERFDRDRRFENIEVKFEKKIERSCCSDREERECGRENRCCF